MTTHVISILNNLIKISKDGEQGFQNAAENISDSELKNILLEKAEKCRTAVDELQKHVIVRNEDPEDSGSLLGMIHRGWITVKSAITGHNDHAILAECERGEDAAKEVYEKALQEDLSEEIRSLIQHQYEGVVANHNLIRDLRDQYKAAS